MKCILKKRWWERDETVEGKNLLSVLSEGKQNTLFLNRKNFSYPFAHVIKRREKLWINIKSFNKEIFKSVINDEFMKVERETSHDVIWFSRAKDDELKFGQKVMTS